MSATVVETPTEGSLSRTWILALFAFSMLPYLIAYPHLENEWVGWAVAVLATLSALLSARGIAAADPTTISRPEKRIATLYSPYWAAIGMGFFMVAVGAASLLVWILNAALDIDVGWPRAVAEVCLLLLIPIAASTAYDEDWRPELVERPPGIPTSFAMYDLGNSRPRFVLLSLGFVIVLGLVLQFGTWWISIPALGIIMLGSAGYMPEREDETDESEIARTAAALVSMDFTTWPLADDPRVEADTATMNPIVQSVDLRASRGDLELAVSVQGPDASPVDWERAERLLSAARSLSWSVDTTDDHPSPVQPLLVLLGASVGTRLEAFANGEHVSIVHVPAEGHRQILVDHITGIDLGELATHLTAAPTAGTNDG